ncbi:MAG: hypothetical protein NC102_09240 [Clostridium sp.]|nr:hypothetical protein [Clostridium sp.]
MDSLIQALQQFFSEYVVALAVVIVAAVWSVWKLASAFQSMRDKVNKVDNLPCADHSAKLDRIIATETKVNALPCADHLEQIKKHEDGHNKVLSRLSSIDTTLLFMQKGIDSLNQSLQKNNRIVTDGYTQTHSPLSITPLGYEMVKRLGVMQMFDNNWHRIEPLIKVGVESRNPYDIQQYCIQQAVVFPEKFLSNEELDKIKLDAYNTGEPLVSYLRVIAVLSRDRYFKENGIDVDDADKSAPAVVS